MRPLDEPAHPEREGTDGAGRAGLYPWRMPAAALCPFCTLDPGRVLVRNERAVAFRDAYPVSRGHALVAPWRHVASFFEATAEERQSMLALLDQTRHRLDAEFGPAGYNIGINDGAAAGQTVGHLHIHLIPRYPGDRPDPRGGVRWVLPEQADYWSGSQQAAPPA